MDITIYLLLLFAGVFGGYISALAGGASFFTFPALLFTGLPPLLANTTNYVALTPGNMMALIASWHYLRHVLKQLIGPLIVSCFGAIAGAILLLWAGNEVFTKLIPWLMALAVFLFYIGPHVRGWLTQKRGIELEVTSPIALATLFVVAAYGAYFGAGLGVIILSGLAIVGYDDLREANAVKNFLISVFSIITVIIFAASGNVHWPYAVAMAFGTALGGYLGGVLTWKLPEGGLRGAIICYGTALTVYYFWKYS
ncbi:MAG: sulfite exporter TauE/SafE family protein [Hyphomicrobiales bacterium]